MQARWAAVVSQLLLGMIAFLPGMAVLYQLLGQHEEHFRHNAMFLVVLGGMALGLAGGFVELIVMADAIWLVSMVAAPLIETMAKTMIVGLPRFHKEREAVLLGGGAGIGVAALILMTYSQTVRNAAISWQLIVTLVSVSIGFTLVHYVSGLLLGQGPAKGSVLAKFAQSYAVLLPAHVLLGFLGLIEDLRLRPLRNYTDVELALGILAYGLALTLWWGPKLIKEGLPQPARRELRRQQRQEARGE